jgi:hypothetical protein
MLCELFIWVCRIKTGGLKKYILVQCTWHYCLESKTAEWKVSSGRNLLQTTELLTRYSYSQMLMTKTSMSVTLYKHHSLQSHGTTDAYLDNELDAGTASSGAPFNQIIRHAKPLHRHIVCQSGFTYDWQLHCLLYPTLTQWYLSYSLSHTE